jgi:hypothetical protein
MIARFAAAAGVFTALGISVAFGQSSTHYMTSISPSNLMNYPKPIPPGWSATTVAPPAAVPVPLERAPEVVVINYGQGGIIAEHRQRFGYYRRAGAKVEVRGPCYSACTILLSYIEPENLCIGERAFMAFHAVRSIEREEYMENETFQYFLNLPRPIQQWINSKGSWQALPLHGYMFMRDRELWAMGYPKCP